ncbi:putative 2-oxoglutarate dehydrogenase E1 component DHKTD1, mitochondrial [Halotydeus destructor]|nr:putative 2-oxoglutarate dehydrogenase E1 component DHKTD1, mitochondrial [Halotydeus destructor]
MGLLVILQSSRAGLKLPRVLNCSKGLYHTKSGVFGHKPVKHDASCPRLSQEETNKNKASIWQLVQAFRENGHLLATINPLETSPELDSSAKKLLEQLDDIQNDSVPVYTKGLIHAEREICSGADLSNYLRSAYSSSISAEFMNCGSEEEKIWFAEKFETLKQKHVISEQEKKDWAEIMLKSELFDKFVGKKFPTVKRYGGEGAESMMVFFQEVFRLTASEGTIKNIVIGMAHRGRLNLLSSLLNFPPVIMFRKMQGLSEFDLSKAEGCVGDVLSHLYTSVDYSHTGKEVRISLLPNPSHLEAVSPAVAGKCRALALKGKNGPYSVEGVPSSSLPIQVHGDAAFAGQGVIVETLAMSNVPHFSVEGSIHLIINNQIGYTTPGDERGRSTRYCSDVMKTIGAPVIHVNGDSAADVALAARLALEYRQTFKKDVCIDLVCFRRWGHNEMDDPTFTNPDIYSKIRSQPETLPVRYAKEVLGEEEFETTISTENMFLAEQFAQTDCINLSILILKATGLKWFILRINIPQTGIPVSIWMF